MTEVPRPTVAAGNENRHLFCQMAIEIPLQGIIEAPVKAGWEETEVLTAINEVAATLCWRMGQMPRWTPF
jgi:hypothetical protein